MDRDILLLDELTGKVHKYHGFGLSKAMLCDCPLIEESYEANKLTVINREYLEGGIWKRGDCLKEKEGVVICPKCEGRTHYIEGEEEECSHCEYRGVDAEVDKALERMREMREENEETYRKMGGV